MVELGVTLITDTQKKKDVQRTSKANKHIFTAHRALTMHILASSHTHTHTTVSILKVTLGPGDAASTLMSGRSSVSPSLELTQNRHTNIHSSQNTHTVYMAMKVHEVKLILH